MSQKLIITTCPWKDYKTGKWMLSAMVNVQLETPAATNLGAFPDILKWMEKIQQAIFYVQWNNGAPAEIKPVTKKWNPSLYEKLFHSGIKVKGYGTINLASVSIKSFPVLHINNFILDTVNSKAFSFFVPVVTVKLLFWRMSNPNSLQFSGFSKVCEAPVSKTIL